MRAFIMGCDSEHGYRCALVSIARSVRTSWAAIRLRNGGGMGSPAGADGGRGASTGSGRREAAEAPCAATRWAGGEPHTTLREAPDSTNALARQRECADQAVEQRARSGRCGSWAGAQDITLVVRTQRARRPQAVAVRAPSQLCWRLPALCTTPRYVESAQPIYPRPAFVPWARERP